MVAPHARLEERNGGERRPGWGQRHSTSAAMRCGAMRWNNVIIIIDEARLSSGGGRCSTVASPSMQPSTNGNAMMMAQAMTTAAGLCLEPCRTHDSAWRNGLCLSLAAAIGEDSRCTPSPIRCLLIEGTCVEDSMRSLASTGCRMTRP